MKSKLQKGLLLILTLWPGSIVNADLLLHHTFDTADISGISNGDIVYDQSGSPALNGVIAGTDVTNPAGIIGEAIGVPGTHTDSIDVAHTTILNPGTGSWTVSLWVNFSDLDSVQGILGKSAGLSGFQCYDIYTSGDDIFMRIGQEDAATGAVNRRNTAIRDILQTEQWYHAVMVLDRDAGTLTSYLNYSTANTITMPAGSVNNDLPLHIGLTKRPPDETAGWNTNGMIDDVAIFNEALSSEEVEAIYLNGLQGVAVPEPATVVLLSLGSGLILRGKK